MIGNSPLAPEYHEPVGEWFERHFAQEYILERKDPYGGKVPSNEIEKLIAQARSHLGSMLEMSMTGRRQYIMVRGCTDTEAAFLERFRSDWLNNSVRRKVTQIAEDCVSQGQGFETILNLWPQQDETRPLRRLMNDNRITQRVLAITFTSCSAADMAMEAYREAVRSMSGADPVSEAPVPGEGRLPEILHEASQTISHQLKAYSGANDSLDDPEIQLPRTEDVAWIGAKLRENWLDDMPVPFIFPTEYGGLNIEWYVGHAEHSLEIDFENHTGMWAWWDSKSGQVYERTLNLKQDGDWHRLQKSSTGRRRSIR